MTSPQDLNGNSEALSWNLMGKQMGQLYEKKKKKKNFSYEKFTLPGSCYDTGPKKYYTPVVAD